LSGQTSSSTRPCLYGNTIVPTTFDAKAPVGTGPFKLTSFSPGQQIVYAANKNYWGGAPHVDTLDRRRVRRPGRSCQRAPGGTVDAISQLPSAQAAAVTGGGQKVLDAHTGAWQPFTMRIDQKPFNDLRVRQAFRLIIDRKQMIEQAFAGYGMEGNDVYAPFDPGTVLAALPQRAQDLAQAKSLLKAAGYDNNLTVVLTTSDAVGSAAVAAAQVFAEQAKGAGRHRYVTRSTPASSTATSTSSGRSRRTSGTRATTSRKPTRAPCRRHRTTSATGKTRSG